MLGYSFTQHIYICLANFSFTGLLYIYIQILEASFASFVSAQCNVHVNKQFIVRHIKMFQKWSFYVEVNLFVRNNKSRCKEDKKNFEVTTEMNVIYESQMLTSLRNPITNCYFLGQVKSHAPSHLYGLVLNILWFATPKLLLPLEAGNSTFLKLTDVVRSTYILVFIEIL